MAGSLTSLVWLTLGAFAIGLAALLTVLASGSWKVVSD